MSEYKYLFPYEKVAPKSKILIYGAGLLGQEYYLQMSITHYCTIIGFVDKNYQKYTNSAITVYSPDDIPSLEFDYVVVALRMAAAFNEIKRNLTIAGVPDDRIVAVYERNYEIQYLFSQLNMKSEKMGYAFLEGEESIAFLVTGGIGDMVIQKKLITEIIRLVPECRIDIYNIKAFEFLKHLYVDVPNIINILPDLGSRYRDNHNKYKLSLTMEACHYIQVDTFDEKYWRSRNLIFADKIQMLIKRIKEENVGISMPAHVTMFRRWYKGENAYTGFNYDGVFGVRDKRVNIPLNSIAGIEFEKIRCSWKNSQYITINCGNGDCADATQVAKSWPIEYYNSLVYLVKEEFHDLDIVQLGGSEAGRIKGCDTYCLGEDFLLVEHILKNSLLHIDIEGGLVHIASQLGTKCIVMFGPTVAEYYGYENNINIRVGHCHNCWGLYTDVNRCARGMDKPECMYSISPQIIYEQVKKVLNNDEK